MSDLQPSPLRSPEYLAPVATYEPPVPDPNRLCSQDGECGHSDAGCRRTETILAWEAETGQYLPGNLVWDASTRDQFFHFDGSIWYYKPHLLATLDIKRTRLAVDKNNQEFLSFIQTLKTICPNLNLDNEVLTLADINVVISAQPAGMPKFIAENTSFLQFEDPGVEYITIENIDKSTLDLIKTLSVGSNWAAPFALHAGLIKSNGAVYNSDLYNWQTVSPDSQSFGIVLSNATDIKFYPFEAETNLNSVVKQTILDCGNYFATQLNKSFQIVYL